MKGFKPVKRDPDPCSQRGLLQLGRLLSGKQQLPSGLGGFRTTAALGQRPHGPGTPEAVRHPRVFGELARKHPRDPDRVPDPAALVGGVRAEPPILLQRAPVAIQLASKSGKRRIL